MSRVRAELRVGSSGPAGFELRIGDRRIPFGFEEAHELVATWPDQAGTPAAHHGAAPEPIEFIVGGQTARLDADEARQLEAMPSQVRRLLIIAMTMANCEQAHHSEGPRWA